MSHRSSQKTNISKTEPIPLEPKRFRYGTSSLVLDEAELRRAGIRNYRVEVKSCTNGKWKVLYNKSKVIAPAEENSQKSNK